MIFETVFIFVFTLFEMAAGAFLGWIVAMRGFRTAMYKSAKEIAALQAKLDASFNNPSLYHPGESKTAFRRRIDGVVARNAALSAENGNLQRELEAARREIAELKKPAEEKPEAVKAVVPPPIPSPPPAPAEPVATAPFIPMVPKADYDKAAAEVSRLRGRVKSLIALVREAKDGKAEAEARLEAHLHPGKREAWKPKRAQRSRTP